MTAKFYDPLILSLSIEKSQLNLALVVYVFVKLTTPSHFAISLHPIFRFLKMVLKLWDTIAL